MQRDTACERPAGAHVSFFNEPVGQSALAAFIAGGGYVLAEGLGTALALPAMAVWAVQSAIVLATLALVAHSRWVFYLLALMLFHVFARLPVESLPETLLDYVGSALTALVGALALRTWCSTPLRFDRLRTTTVLILCVGLLAPLIGSLTVEMLAASMPTAPTGEIWAAALPRMLYGTFAALTLVPLIVHATTWLMAGGTPSARRTLESFALVLVLTGASVAVQGFPQTTVSLLLLLDAAAALLLLLAALLAERREMESTARRAEIAEYERRQEVVYLGRAAMMGELSGAFVHELNQPLTSILGNAQAAMQLLERKSVDAIELREILGDIISDDRRASEVLQRVRDLLTRDVQKQMVDLRALILDTLQLLHSELVKRRVSATPEIDPELPHVLVDRVQIGQVLLNLILSGSETAEPPASNLSAPRVLSIAARYDRQAHMIEISACSATRDIAAASSEDLLKQFFTTRRDPPGLGLTISRSIIETHGGTMWARRDRENTVVGVSLPG